MSQNLVERFIFDSLLLCFRLEMVPLRQRGSAKSFMNVFMRFGSRLPSFALVVYASVNAPELLMPQILFPVIRTLEIIRRTVVSFMANVAMDLSELLPTLQRIQVNKEQIASA